MITESIRKSVELIGIRLDSIDSIGIQTLIVFQLVTPVFIFGFITLNEIYEIPSIYNKYSVTFRSITKLVWYQQPLLDTSFLMLSTTWQHCSYRVASFLTQKR